MFIFEFNKTKRKEKYLKIGSDENEEETSNYNFIYATRNMFIFEFDKTKRKAKYLNDRTSGKSQ